MNKDEQISAIILAGGKGVRMSNKDKGLQLFQGRPLVEHCIDNLIEQSDDIIISCNRNIDSYAQYNFQTVSDDNNNYDGPLAGILAASLLASHELLFVYPCDMPLLPDKLANEMRKLLEQDAADICVCFDGKRQQNLVMLFRKHCIPSLAEFLTEGQRKVRLWQQRWKVSELDCSSLHDLFININTPDELVR